MSIKSIMQLFMTNELGESGTEGAKREASYPRSFLEWLKTKNSAFRVPDKLSEDVMKGIDYAVATLSDKQQAAVFFRFNLGKSFKETAELLSVSEEETLHLLDNAALSIFESRTAAFIEEGLIGRINGLVMSGAEEISKLKCEIEYNKGYRDGLRDAGKTLADEDSEKLSDSVLKRTLNEMMFSSRVHNCLEKAGIKTVADIVLLTERELRAIPNIGQSSVEEVVKRLAAIGLQCREELPPPDFANVYGIKEVRLAENDVMLRKRTETSVLLDEMNIMAVSRIIIGGSRKELRYAVLCEKWEEFHKELFEDLQFRSFGQERFAEEIQGNRMHYDISYEATVVSTDGSELKYSGGVSSKGVHIMRELFDRYFALPQDAEYSEVTE